MIASPSSPESFPEDVHESAHLLAFLHAADRAGDEPALYAALDDTLSRLIDYDRFSIGRVDHGTRRIMLVFERGVTIGLPMRYESLPTDARSLPHAVAREGRVVVHTVPEHHDTYRGDPLWRRFGIRQVLAVPVPIDGVTVAVLKLYRTSNRAFTETETRTAETFGRVLGLALAARRARARDGDVATAREVTARIDRIAHATSTDEVLDELRAGIVDITGAAALLFRIEQGEARFVEGHNATPALLMGQPLHEVGPRTARRVAEIIPGGVDPDSPTTLFTDPGAAGDVRVPVRAIDAGHEILAANATALTILGDPDAPLYAIMAAWPETVSPASAARHAEWIDQLSKPAEIHFRQLVRTESLEQQVAELDIVRRLIDTVARTPRLRDAFGVICRTSKLVTNLDFVAIAEAVSDHVVWHAVSGARDPSFLGQRLPVPPRILDDFLQHRHEILLEDIRREPDLTPEIIPVHTREQLRTTVILPVHVNARLRGAMIASQRHQHTFSPAQLSLLHQLAGTVATAIAANDARMAASADE